MSLSRLGKDQEADEELKPGMQMVADTFKKIAWFDNHPARCLARIFLGEAENITAEVKMTHSGHASRAYHVLSFRRMNPPALAIRVLD